MDVTQQPISFGDTDGNQNASVSKKVNNSETTLKLVSNRTHVGPAVKSQSSNLLLSAAANKIRLNNDLKVKPNNQDPKDPKEVKVNSRSLKIINRKGSITVPEAFAIMEAWDELFGDKPGTPDYIEKANRLDAVRSQVYSSLGINPQKGKRPELTEEQRVAYSEAVKAYSFDYYEVRLSFKQTGHKAVRSKTFRYLIAPDLNDIKSKLIRRCKGVNSKWIITQGSAD